MHGVAETLRLRRSTPPFVLAARGRLDFHLAFTNFIPVSAKCCPAALCITLEHSTPSVFVRVAVDLHSNNNRPLVNHVKKRLGKYQDWEGVCGHQYIC